MKLEREDGPRGFYLPVTQQFIALWYELEKKGKKKKKKFKSTFGLNSVGRTRNRKYFLSTQSYLRIGLVAGH